MKINEVQSSCIESLVGNDTCSQKNNDEFYVNSPCIFTEDKIVEIGKIYMLVGVQIPGKSSNCSVVQVLAIYTHEGKNILVIDLETRVKHNIVIGHAKDIHECAGQIIDVDYLYRTFMKRIGKS